MELSIKPLYTLLHFFFSVNGILVITVPKQCKKTNLTPQNLKITIVFI